jgi:hypothetical protein
MIFTVVLSPNADKDIHKLSRAEKCMLVDKSVSTLSKNPYPQVTGTPK